MTAQKNLCDFVGAGFFPTKLDEAWKHFLPDSINPHSYPDENYIYSIKVLFPSSMKSHNH